MAAKVQGILHFASHDILSGIGGYGELVERAEDIHPALERAFASGLPACVNVLIDPDKPYGRSTNVAV